MQKNNLKLIIIIVATKMYDKTFNSTDMNKVKEIFPLYTLNVCIYMYIYNV